LTAEALEPSPGSIWIDVTVAGGPVTKLSGVTNGEEECPLTSTG